MITCYGLPHFTITITNMDNNNNHLQGLQYVHNTITITNIHGSTTITITCKACLVYTSAASWRLGAAPTLWWSSCHIMGTISYVGIHNKHVVDNWTIMLSVKLSTGYTPLPPHLQQPLLFLAPGQSAQLHPKKEDCNRACVIIYKQPGESGRWCWTPPLSASSRCSVSSSC